VLYWSHLYNFQHFHSCNFTITIQVVHVEGPVQLLLKTSSWGDGEGTNELSEVDGPISVFIKGSEGMLGKLWSISIWKKLQNKIINRTVGNTREQAVYPPAKCWSVRHWWGVAGGFCVKLKIHNISFCNSYSVMIIKNLFLQISLCLLPTVLQIYLTQI